MTPKGEPVLAVLDVGSHKTRMLVAELHEGSLRYRGHGVAASAGIRRGVIADLKPATESINQASVLAEASSQAVIEQCVAGIGGNHVRGVNSQGGIALGSKMREITREDVRAAADRARAISLPSDREILHLLPRHFLLDEVPGIHDPVGMVGHQLEVSLHLATCSASAHQSLVTCCNKAGLAATETVYEALAAAESSLSPDERELGCCLIDIGAGSTELIVYFEGAVVYTAAIPIGGSHFTNDLAVGQHLGLPEAEYLKCEYGHAVVTSVSQTSEIEWQPEDQGVMPRGSIRQRALAEILEPRARELFTLIRDSLRNGAVLEALGAGCVLVGGGAKLAGLLDTAESILRVPARIGTPVPLSRMPAELQQPEYATLVGLMLYAHRTSTIRAEQEGSLRAKLRSMFAGSI
ncbi:cell division protein FtsA [Acidipila sp. EB88]|uniref:cell division protein FtsA n=1 Tax=Acidipila sp. EB88 TaxID=2305226 RepID=UPI000F5D7057|nr:cell division protein FtsA [Acidipila sp. EB88]RRA48879.1 cell division protein FtsA [Acidipila sp. EB88]